MEHGIKIVFMGTPEFGSIVLEKLCKANSKPVLVITAPDKPVGRKQILTPPPVKIAVEKYTIPILQPHKIQDTKYDIQNTSTDLIIVAAYGQILPKEILDIPKYGSLNLHPSLLPRWRGASPIQYTILAGDEEAGVSIILMDEKVDHGKIIASAKYEIGNTKIIYGELLQKLANLGAELLTVTIPKWVEGEIEPKSQDESKVTFSKTLKKEDGKIDWKKPALEIERRIRAFENWPGSFCSYCAAHKICLRLKILKANVLKQKDNEPSENPGKTFLTPDNKITVQTGKDFLVIKTLQLEGKKPTTAEDFLRGHPDFIGQVLG